MHRIIYLKSCISGIMCFITYFRLTPGFFLSVILSCIHVPENNSHNSANTTTFYLTSKYTANIGKALKRSNYRLWFYFGTTLARSYSSENTVEGVNYSHFKIDFCMVVKWWRVDMNVTCCSISVVFYDIGYDLRIHVVLQCSPLPNYGKRQAGNVAFPFKPQQEQHEENESTVFYVCTTEQSKAALWLLFRNPIVQ